jgi:hypothetical protein
MGYPTFGDKIMPGQMPVIWKREWADFICRLQGTWALKNMEREWPDLCLGQKECRRVKVKKLRYLMALVMVPHSHKCE